MLVLSRQKDQTIIIGDTIEVMVLDVRGDKVRLGIVAPRDVSVHRKEVYRMLKEAEAAAASGASQSAPSASQAASGTSQLAPAPQSAMQPGVPVDQFMQAAIDEAKLGQSEGGLPVGAVLVRQGKIIGHGHNRQVQNRNPMAHAVIECLANAGRQKTYKDTVLYSTLMPCHLSSGAVLQVGIPRVVAGESKNFAGVPVVLRKQGVEVIDLHDSQCIAMLADFIKAHPDLWTEDASRRAD